MTTAISSIYTARYRELIEEFPLREIHTRKEADAATRILDKLITKDFDDKGEEAYAKVLVKMLEDYEGRHEPFRSPTSGLDLLRFLVKESKVKQGELATLLGIGQAPFRW